MLEFMRTLVNGVKKYIDDKINQLKPDWHQNNTSAPDYIKNRPGGYIDAVELFEYDIDFTYNYPPCDEPIVVGTTYIITYNGVEYRCVGRQYSSTFYIGNGLLTEHIPESSPQNEPFCIYNWDTNAPWCIVSNNRGSMKVMKERANCFDVAYLPIIDIADKLEDVGIDVPPSVLQYAENADGYTVFSKSCTDNHICIPNKHKGQAVTRIGNFYQSNNLVSITIPDSVTSLEGRAFSGCTSLLSIDLPDSVTIIENGAFENCTSLMSVGFPMGIIDINDSICSGCISLVNINIPAGVTSISDYAFQNCTNLTNVSVPDGIIKFGARAFIGCSSLQYNEYDNALYLGNSENPYVVLVKSKNTSISSCTIHEHTKVIGSSAFENCANLTNITVPNEVVSINSNAFYQCTTLTNINIPNSVTYIGESAFAYCNSLTNLIIPDSVITIDGKNIIRNCTSLISVSLPGCMTQSVSQLFQGCTALSAVTVSDENPVYHSAGNCIIKTESKELICGCKSSIIPSDGSVTSIGDYAFQHCENLTSIDIPNGITSIGKYAFCECNNLTHVNLSNSVTNLGDNVFSHCRRLSHITISENITNINNTMFQQCDSLNYNVYNNAQYLGNNTNPYIVLMKANNTSITSCAVHGDTKVICGSAFRYCSKLNNIVIPNGVVSINDNAFRGCTQLYSITLPNSVIGIGFNAFSNCTGLTNITIPNSVQSVQGSAFYYCTNLTNVVIPDNTISTGYGVFSYCTSLHYNEYDNALYLGSDMNPYSMLIKAKNTSISSCAIHQNTKTIYAEAFSGCENLTNIVIPSGVGSIGDSAFWHCTNLVSVNIPGTVTNIGDNAFGWCENLADVIILDGVTQIGKGMFIYCVNLDNIVIPNSIINVGESAFEGCKNLTRIIVPYGTTSIGEYAFRDCTKLTSMYLPDSITKIGRYVFYGCINLISVIIPEDIDGIGNGEFANCSSVKEIHFKSITPPILGDTEVFSETPSTCKFFVPMSSVDAYKTATYWSSYARRIIGE